MEYVIWALSVIAALFVGGYLKSYMSKKGENLATKEDIAALTRITTEIEHAVSTKAWARDARKEAAFEVLQCLATADAQVNRLFELATIPEHEAPGATGRRISLFHDFEIAHVNYVKAKLLAGVVCGKEVKSAFERIEQALLVVARFSLEGEYRDAIPSLEALTNEVARISELIRKDLGIEL